MASNKLPQLNFGATWSVVTADLQRQVNQLRFEMTVCHNPQNPDYLVEKGC